MMVAHVKNLEEVGCGIVPGKSKMNEKFTSIF